LSTAIDGLRVVGGDICAGSVSIGGTALMVFFWCVVVAGYFLVGIQQRHRGGQMKKLLPNVGIH